MLANKLRSIAGKAPALPDPHWSNTVLLLHCDGAGDSTVFTDATGKHSVTRAGDAKLSTAKAKFGSASVYFDGAGDYLQVDSSSDFAFGLGDFAIEMWVCPDYAYTGEPAMLFDPRLAGTTNPGPILSIGFSKFMYSNSNTYHIYGTTYPVPGTWYHLALSRISNVTRLFVNGVQEGATYTDNFNNVVGTGNRPLIGVNAWNASSGPFKGWLDEIRITKGVGRYGADFTPPAAPFPNS